MKKNLAAIFCLCVFFSSPCFAESNEQHKAAAHLSFVTSRRIVNNEIPNIFRPIGNWFKRHFEKKQKNSYCPPNAPPIINNVILSVSEILKECSTQKSIPVYFCQGVDKTITVSTFAQDDENDVLVYYYEVSGGKIIGHGSKVFWDLSEVKPGTYTITVGADDGAGFEGRAVTKEIKVIECPNCN